jgi:REP element-mobilizing transposase RayT
VSYAPGEGLDSRTDIVRARWKRIATLPSHEASVGAEGKAIYRDDSDRAHFLELLGEATERFGIRVHAYVLMHNHYHLLLETPEANLSRAIQWLNVSYSVCFNRRHHRAGQPAVALES